MNIRLKEYFGPNFWPNTPDILPVSLQTGGKPAFLARLVMAATMTSNYGMYGAAFELLESTPFKPGGEEYLNSEKYETKALGAGFADEPEDAISRR